jgi:hypothetical protein
MSTYEEAGACRVRGPSSGPLSLLLRILPLALAGIFVTADAGAAANCEQYARSAVVDQERNVALGCGYAGPRWSTDEAGHFRWCAGARQTSVDAESAVRRNGLTNCEFCARYADDAVAAQERNLASGCNLTGARWSADRNGHFRWCMGARRESVNREAQFRNFDVGKCEQCVQYAQKAVAAQGENLAKDCRLTGPAWSENFAAHYRWCWNLETRGALGSEEAARASLLRHCAAATVERRADCERYALSAVGQYGEYKQHGCGRSGERWHDNYQNHYGWCLAVQPAEMIAHQKSREEELTRCRGARDPGKPPLSEHCAVTVELTNGQCFDGEGRASEYRDPGSLQVTGCGDSWDKARARAKLSFLATEHGICSDGLQENCCVVTERRIEGCLCSY